MVYGSEGLTRADKKIEKRLCYFTLQLYFCLNCFKVKKICSALCVFHINIIFGGGGIKTTANSWTISFAIVLQYCHNMMNKGLPEDIRRMIEGEVMEEVREEEQGVNDESDEVSE